MNAWRPLIAAAALSVTLGARTAAAQTVMVRNAPPGEAIEVALDATNVAAGTTDAGGVATLPLDLTAHGNKTEMSENLTLGFSTTGTCTHTYTVKAADPTGAADQGSPYTLTANGSGSYSGSVLSLGQQGWSVGVHTFTIWDITANAATTAVKTFKVCASGSGSCLGANWQCLSDPSIVPPYASATITVSSIMMRSKPARSIERAMST